MDLFVRPLKLGGFSRADLLQDDGSEEFVVQLEELPARIYLKSHDLNI